MRNFLYDLKISLTNERHIFGEFGADRGWKQGQQANRNSKYWFNSPVVFDRPATSEDPGTEPDVSESEQTESGDEQHDQHDDGILDETEHEVWTGLF